MTASTQKVLRVMTPGFLFVLGYWTTRVTFYPPYADLSLSPKDGLYLFIAIGLGCLYTVYYSSKDRYKRIFKDIKSHRLKRLRKIAISPHHKETDEHLDMSFWRIVDTDPTLSQKSLQLRANGTMATGVRDFANIAILSAILNLIFGLCHQWMYFAAGSKAFPGDQTPPSLVRLLLTEIDGNRIIMAFVLISASLIARYSVLKRAVDHHRVLADKQLDYIERYHAHSVGNPELSSTE